jgi:hypothetical protein
MDFENLEEILKMSEKDFEREVEKTQIIDLIARIEKFQAVLKKPDLGIHLLTGMEITPKRKKLGAFVTILTKVKDTKEKERFNQNRQTREKWRDDYLRDNLRDIRFVAGSEAEHVMHGDFTVDAVGWQTPQSTEYEILGRSGNKIKINLKKIIAPSTLQMLIDHPLVPVFLTVEATGAYQGNRKLGYFVSSEWSETRGIEIRLGTMIALMKV